MGRPPKFTEEQIQYGIQKRAEGYTWVSIAHDLGVTRDIVLYHCSPKRKAQVQSAIRKYHSNNYEKVRKTQQKYHATDSKVQ